MVNIGSDIKIERANALNLKGVSLEIKRGCLLVTGPMGSGKTALLKHTIAAESAYRVGTLLNPLEIDRPTESQANITELPPVIFLSGENPLPPNHSIGEHLGLFRQFGRMLVQTPFVCCLNCKLCQERETLKEQIIKISPPADCDQIRLIAKASITASESAAVKNKWLQSGYENLESIKVGEGFELSAQLDRLSIREFSLQRLTETITTTLKLQPKHYLVSFYKDDSLQKEQKISIGRECQKCGEPFPKISATLLSELVHRAINPKNNEAPRYALSGYSLSSKGDLTGEQLIQLSFKQLQSLPSLLNKLDSSQQAAVKLLSNSPLSDIKLNTLLSKISSHEYLLLNLIKAFSLAPAKSLIVLDEPFVNPSSVHIKMLSELAQAHIALGGSVIIGSLHDSFKTLASQIVCLGPEGGTNGGNLIPEAEKTIGEINSPLKKQLILGLNQDSLLSMPNAKDPISIDWKNIYQGKEKDVLSLLKISDELASLFGSTIAAKSLGVKNKAFTSTKSSDPKAQLIRYKGRTFDETCKLPIIRIGEEFTDIVKIRQKIEVATTLGLNYLPLSQAFSTLSLREKILLTITALVISKPKNRVIEIRNILGALPEKSLNTVLSCLTETLGKTNSITVSI